ncbi:MAG: octanoyltransferase [Gammaproteobacteria bacterium RIFOXYD12_FULL_61_37]|nr:MAG: octanoyltransferase [Gammaproteobacteria bacterium RIFOXYD12_FULL_61_37]
MTFPLLVRRLGLQPYLPVWEAMRRFTDLRDGQTPSELWLLQHPPVFTLGQAGKKEHLLNPGDIPVQQIDRGGQVTYHGPGQLLAYLLLDLKETGTGVRGLVQGMEDAVISLLAGHGIEAHARREAPGVYVAGAKIAALGLRVRKGFCYHGLSLNVDLDLEPFSRINPCGYQGLAVTSLRQLGSGLSIGEIQGQLSAYLCDRLGYTAQDAAGRLPV